MTPFEYALQHYGLFEVARKENNPKIVAMFTSMHKEWRFSDATSWCSAFINWCCIQARVKGSGRLDARSWLRMGEGVELADAIPGDVVVFWRGASDHEPIYAGASLYKGHVGFYINKPDRSGINVFGGNQSDMAKISRYPKNRLLGVRRLET